MYKINKCSVIAETTIHKVQVILHHKVKLTQKARESKDVKESTAA